MSLDAITELLACPSCGESLGLSGRTLRCAGGHSFDLARQGYANLANGPEPANADTAGMLQARRRVQQAGLFAPLTEELAQLCAHDLTILDVGAGTGHHLAGCLPAEGVGLAIDISKSAARLAARVDGRIGAVVADVWQGVPVRSGVLDSVLCVFAPRNLAEFRRVLRPEGHLIVVTPEADHLLELREAFGLIGIEAGKQERLLAAASGLFSLVATRDVAYRRDCSADQVADLIAMGPNAFHGLHLDPPAMNVSFDVRVAVFSPIH
ncbi:MAG: methyltransferase domain-containing protein [Micropruina sp.]|nr:methyltransferase domain-containing protein [Micropruina sp.]